MITPLAKFGCCALAAAALYYLTTAVALYYLTIAVALRFFLSNLVFLAVPLSVTHENRLLVVNSNGAQGLIREYKSDENRSCVLYFPGQHGGIARYEKEIFAPVLAKGVSVYAISYPGYEGAEGKPTLRA